MLLLRTVLGLILLVQGGFYLGVPNPAPAMWVVGIAALAAGAALVVGLLTTLAAVLAGLGAAGVGLSLLPACNRTLLDSRAAIVLAATMLVAVLLMGPGAFSGDARLFGRRQIIIPPAPSRR